MGRQRKSNESLKFFVGVFFAVVMILGVFFVTRTTCGEKNGGDGSGLPRMELLLSGVSLTEIYSGERDTKYEGNELTIRDEDGSVFLTGVQVKGRGNTTWGEPKKPFRLKFTKKVDLLGLGSARKWVLLANNLDDTLMRNDVTFYVNKLIGGNYALSGKFVSLVVDGEDLGVYYLTKSIGDVRETMQLRDPMGVLVELDNVHRDGELMYETGSGDCLVLKDVISDDNAVEALNEFSEVFEMAEYYARMGDYGGLNEVVDLESFAEYFLITEFTNNPDGFSTSWWFYKNGPEDVIHAGPAWDFDFALGNTKWGDVVTSDFHDPKRPLVNRENALDVKEQSDEVSKIMYYMLEIPEFRKKVDEIYREKLMGRKEEVISYIEERADYLRDAAKKDAEMWEKNDFDEAVEYLIWWVENRFRMMDAEYGSKVMLPVEMREI